MESCKNNQGCSIAAVILAGGQGSRMGGEDKGLVTFQQRPMVSWTLDKVTPLVNEVVISCNRNQLRYQEFGVKVLSDQEQGFLGPLAGIQAALAELSTRHTHLLVLPCDTPLISVRILNRLIEHALENPEAISVLSENKRTHCLHAMIPTCHADNLNQALEDGMRAVHRWYKQFPLSEIELCSDEDLYTLINFNQLVQLQEIG